jgi:hypothetical protein
LDDLQIALKPALGAAFSDSSKIFCQEMTRFHDEDPKPYLVYSLARKKAGRKISCHKLSVGGVL